MPPEGGHNLRKPCLRAPAGPDWYTNGYLLGYDMPPRARGSGASPN